MINSGGINSVGINSSAGVIAFSGVIIDTSIFAPPARILTVPVVGVGDLGRVVQQPEDILDYNIDFGPWLGADKLATCVFTSSPGLTVGLFTTLTTQAKLWAQGGESGNEYRVTATARTRAGRAKQVDFIIEVKDI